MAITNDYFIGQGELMVRRLNDDETPAEAFWGLGDTEQFTTDTSTSVQKHYESTSGARRLAASWNNQTDQTFTLNVKNFNLENLSALMAGTQNSSVAAGSVTGESITLAAGGSGTVYTQYPGISAVTVYDALGGSPYTQLVEGTDYTIDSVGGISGFGGGITILAGAPNYTGPNLVVDYTHVGIQGSVEALTTPFQKYSIRFNAVNMKNPGTPVIVEVPVAQFYPAESVSWIGNDAVATFDFTGDILTPSDGSAPIVVTESNAI